jgi:dTDP-glucose pyrophosphorylase
MKDVKDICIQESISVHKCMEVIDRNKEGIALIVNAMGQLIGTVTDGDIRRFIIAGKSLDEPVRNMMWKNPVTALVGTSEKELIELMKKHSIRHIPLLDEQRRPQNLVSLRDILFEEDTGHTAVIMAGGEGRRLRPITENVPKPMIEVAGRPILETIVRQLVKANIKKIYISINYMSESIENYFKDGTEFGVKIAYLKEERKLGTAGALTLLPEIPPKPFLVVNGDVITKTDFAHLIDFHREHRCVMTVAGVQYRFNIPYGVLNTAGHYLLGIEEKPQQKFLCNAGIYLINPEVCNFIPYNVEVDMTDIIDNLVKKGLPIATFPIFEYWLDIGKMEDLKKAQNELKGE